MSRRSWEHRLTRRGERVADVLVPALMLAGVVACWLLIMLLPIGWWQ